MMHQSALGRSLVALVLGSAIGCAAAPHQRRNVDQGPESITAARKFLQGRWMLESFEVFPPGKAPIVLKGSGTLEYDDFGNLRMEIHADEPSADLLRAAGVELRDGTISSDGRAAVDLQNRTLTYVLPDQPRGAPGPLAASRPRHWEVKGDLLLLSTRDESGTPLSTGRWKRVP